MTPELAEATLRDLDQFAQRFRRELGINFVYGADEWYRLLDRAVPSSSRYDGFPQLENGIGMTRWFFNRMARARQLFPRAKREGWRLVTLVTGELFRPTLERTVREKLVKSGEELKTRVVGVPNRFFGPRVTVAGLLVGRDILAGLAGQDLGDAVVLPPATINDRNHFLDDLSLEDLERELRVPVQVGFRDHYF